MKRIIHAIQHSTKLCQLIRDDDGAPTHLKVEADVAMKAIMDGIDGCMEVHEKLKGIPNGN